MHIGDRESDIYELFAKFLVVTCVDRLAGDGQTTVAQVMRASAAKGRHKIEVPDKQAAYAPLVLSVIHARETSAS
ncbi:MAG TPA: hypothetical protein VHH73_09830 [Verrucomicrobiae bacterium]|nr:hypothetical protein [Verrucomicrobiae bacterium]